LQETETGEEDEEVLFRAECKLTKLVKDTPAASPAEATQNEADNATEQSSSTAPPQESCSTGGSGGNTWRWQERGCGIVHINKHRKTGACRLVMRLRGVLKLLLNTPVFPTTKYEKLGKKSVSFVGVDSEVNGGTNAGGVALSSYRLTLQNGDQQAKFLEVLRAT